MSIAEIQTVGLPTYLPPQVGWQESDEKRYEIVNGQRVKLPEMSVLSSVVGSRIQGFLFPYVHANRLGHVVCDAMFILDPKAKLLRSPDVAFVSHATWPEGRPLPDAGNWEVVPDLAIEVLSPNDLFDQVIAKVSEYFEHGVKQVWLVLPILGMVYVYDSPTQVCILTKEQDLESALMPGNRLKLAEIFQN